MADNDDYMTAKATDDEISENMWDRLQEGINANRRFRLKGVAGGDNMVYSATKVVWSTDIYIYFTRESDGAWVYNKINANPTTGITCGNDDILHVVLNDTTTTVLTVLATKPTDDTGRVLVLGAVSNSTWYGNILGGVDVTQVEAVITAELVDGQSIDAAIDALILTHKNISTAHHTPPVAGDFSHNSLDGLNDGTAYEHITQTQKDALHAVVTTLTHTALTGKNDETDIKHLTDAQLSALHAVVVAGDLNHNDLANINAGDAYEHISATQLAALHTKYVLTEDLSSQEITQLQTIGESTTIIAGQWGYLGALTESPQTHMDASNPHSGSGDMNGLIDDQTPQLYADLDVNKQHIHLNKTALTSGTATGVIMTMTAGENLAFPNMVYIAADGDAMKADANSNLTMPVVGMAIETITSGNPIRILLHGHVYWTSWTFAVGDRGETRLIYASATPAGITQTPPSAVGDQIQVLGTVVEQSHIIFNPSYVLVERKA